MLDIQAALTPEQAEQARLDARVNIYRFADALGLARGGSLKWTRHRYVRTAQGQLTVTPQNLLRAYAFFRYGEALQWPFPSMRDWVASVAAGGGVPDLTAVTVPEPGDEQLIQYSNDPQYTPAPFPFAVETLVLVFNPGGPVLPAC